MTASLAEPQGDATLPAGALAMLLLIGASLVLSMSTWFSATAILTELTQVFQLSPNAASWLTNAVQIGFVVAALGLSISGLADAIPTRTLMVASGILATLSNLAMLWVPDAASLFAARFVTGMALAGIYPPALKLISTWFIRGRGVAMGAAVGALTLGSSAPYLIKTLGGRLDWTAVVVGSSSAALIGAAILCLVREGPYRGPRPKADLKRIAAVVRDPILGLANFGYFGHMWELYGFWGWFLAFATRADRAQHETLPISAATLTFVVIGVGAIGCIAGGVLSDRMGRTATTAGMMLVSGACAVAIGATFAGPAWLFVVIALVWGFTVIADSAQFSAMISELSDARSVGAALALQVGVGFALSVVSIRLTPFVAGLIGWRWTFAMLAPGPWIGAVAMLALRRLPQSRVIANGRR